MGLRPSLHAAPLVAAPPAKSPSTFLVDKEFEKPGSFAASQLSEAVGACDENDEEIDRTLYPVNLMGCSEETINRGDADVKKERK